MNKKKYIVAIAVFLLVIGNSIVFANEGNNIERSNVSKTIKQKLE